MDNGWIFPILLAAKYNLVHRRAAIISVGKLTQKDSYLQATDPIHHVNQVNILELVELVESEVNHKFIHLVIVLREIKQK